MLHVKQMRRLFFQGLFLFGLVMGLMLAAPAARAQIAGTNWFPIGPAPIDGFFGGGVSGRASAIAVNPQNVDEVWIGGAAGGVWHSLDAGLNWEPISDEEDTLAIGALAVAACDPSGCDQIYAGTGENAIRRDTYYGGGLLVGGMTGGEFPVFVWQERSGNPFDFRGASIIDIVVDPTTSGATTRLFIALSSGVTVSATEATVTSPGPATGNFGLYRSDSNGSNWSVLTVPGSAGAVPTDLEMEPGDENVLYAGFLGRGVFKTVDGGSTWCPLGEGIALPPGCANTSGLPDVSANFDHVEIAIHRDDPQVVFASFGFCADRLIQNCVPSIYRSTDGGATWQERFSGNPNDGNSLGNARVYSRYTHGFAVDPSDADTLFLGGIKLWRSTNGGQSFVASDQNLAPGSSPWGAVIHLDHREILFHPVDDNRVYNTSDGGFAVSTNGGVSWTPRNDDLQITGFQSLGASPLTGAVIGASQDNGGALWNGNRRWGYLDCCGDGGFSLLDKNDVMTMIVGNNWGEPRRTTNGGVSWSDYDAGLPSNEPRLFYAPFIQDPSPPHPLYYGAQSLYRRAAGDASWNAVSPVLATGAEPEIVTATSTFQHVNVGGQNSITAIAVAPNDPDRVYVGFYGGEVFRSVGAPCNAAGCWTRIDDDLPAAPVTRLAVHPTNSATVIATLSGFGAGAKVWRTTNSGDDWNASATGVPAGVPANTVAYEPSFPQNVFLGLDSAPGGASLYKSTNGGVSWSPFADGLPNAPVYEIVVDEDHGRAYAATHGRGAFVLGEPFIANFEGWVDDRIWDIPVYGQNFLPNQACTMQILQSNGDVCASGGTDVMGGVIETNGDGVLVTSNGGFWNDKPVAWACFNGDCLGGTPIANCYDDADGDGDPDPLSTIVVACGGQLATGTVLGCPTLDNPPSSLVELNLDGLEGGGGDGGGGGGGLAGAFAVEEVGGGGEAAPERRLRLVASVQARTGTRSLCAVTIVFRADEDAATVLARARDAVNADAVCSAASVRAVLDTGFAFESEDAFPRAPRLRLDAPAIRGGQLITTLEVDPGALAGGLVAGDSGRACLRLDGLGIPLLNQIHVLKIGVETPAGGAAGGRVTFVERTALGVCELEVTTSPGDDGAAIAAALVAAQQAPGIPGPHPGCPARRNPRDLVIKGGELITVAASSVEVCSDDPRVGFDLRPEELLNAHPTADAGGDRVVAASEPVVLDGSASSDPDSTPGTADDLALYEWHDVTTGTAVLLGEGETLAVPLDRGLHRIRLRVTDQGGLSAVDEALVTVGQGGGGGAGRFAVSFHLGRPAALFDFDDAGFEGEIAGEFDFEWRFAPRHSLEVVLGRYDFDHAAGFDATIDGLTVYLRGYFAPRSSAPRFYWQVGPGLYDPDLGSSALGLSGGGGLQIPVGSRLEVELGGAYFHFFQSGSQDEIDFLLGRVGFKVTF